VGPLGLGIGNQKTTTREEWGSKSEDRIRGAISEVWIVANIDIRAGWGKKFNSRPTRIKNKTKPGRGRLMANNPSRWDAKLKVETA